MSSGLSLTRMADDVFEVSVSSPRRAQALRRRLSAQGHAEEIVAGLDRVCVRFHPDNFDETEAWLRGIAMDDLEEEVSASIIEIGVQYGGEVGPDLDAICAKLNMSQEALVELHTSQIHTVEMIGFTPGFSYISGLPSEMDVPRLSTPRARVPAGSIGISASYTGIYALAGPGGWPLIGRTPEPLFDAAADTPFRLLPGQRVQFRAI